MSSEIVDVHQFNVKKGLHPSERPENRSLSLVSVSVVLAQLASYAGLLHRLWQSITDYHTPLIRSFSLRRLAVR